MKKFAAKFLQALSYLENRKIGRSKVPLHVILLSLFAATGGLMFGYDIGISGGVTVMDDFLCQFFTGVLEKKIKSQGLNDIRIKSCKHISKEDWDEDGKYYKEGHKNQLYCLFGKQTVQLFTSSLYLAAMVGTCFAAYVSRRGGRKMTIILAGLFYDLGVVLNIASGSIHHGAFSILIVGRVMLGLGVGFGNQAVPLFISEIAPANARGALNHLFQLNVTIGIFLASIVNWKAETIHPWGWRLSLGLAGVPALVFTLGGFLIVETPNSLVQRGLTGQAQEVLNKLRGQGLGALQAMVAATKDKNDGLLARCNRPPLIVAIFVQLFQQFTGINVVILYAPVLFKALGSTTEASLHSAIVLTTVNLVFTIVSIFLVDHYGRRRLLLVASLLMFVAQLLTGIILIGTSSKDNLKPWRATTVLIFISIFMSAFACSWGPVGWFISTEIFPLACRSEGQSVTVFFNMLFTFIIAHASISMMCTMTFKIFFFFASWAAIMGTLTYIFLPETMNIEIEIMSDIWRYHKLWKHFITQDQVPSPPHLALNQSPSRATALVEMNNVIIRPLT